MTPGIVPVAEYGDLARRTSISRREVDAVVRTLNETGGPVLVPEEWLVAEKDLPDPLPGTDRVFAVQLLKETEKAWCVLAAGGSSRGDGVWVPKSCSTLFERASGVEAVSTPATTLSEFGGESA